MKIYLRKLNPLDAEVSWRWRNDPEVWKLTGRKWNNYVTKEIEEQWIQRALLEDNSIRLAICIYGSDEYIGNVQLTDIFETNAIFHLFIGEKKFWGKGVGYIATQQMLFYAKNQLGLKLITLSVKKNNFAAIKIYQKVGFKVVEYNDDLLTMNCEL